MLLYTQNQTVTLVLHTQSLTLVIIVHYILSIMLVILNLASVTVLQYNIVSIVYDAG